jgi:hypothetical protein
MLCGRYSTSKEGVCQTMAGVPAVTIAVADTPSALRCTLPLPTARTPSTLDDAGGRVFGRAGACTGLHECVSRYSEGFLALAMQSYRLHGVYMRCEDAARGGCGGRTIGSGLMSSS